jgi:hypothetical protein
MYKIFNKRSYLLLALGALASHPGLAQDAEEGSGRRPQVSINEQFGSLNYSVPFPALPNRAGVHPDLELAYSQIPGDAGQGFGLAWSIHVPSISIQSETHLRSHGFLENIHENFDARFRLALDGVNLSFVSFDSQSITAEYTLEKHSAKVRIIRHFYPFDVQYLAEDGQMLTRSLGSGFEVIHADGRRQYFSGDLDVAEGVNVPSSIPDNDQPAFSSFVARWPLVLEVHPGGEAVQYEYVKDQGRSFLSRVNFAGGQSFYQLSWILREAGLESHAQGFPQTSRLLYTGMAACFKETALHTWRFDYGLDPRNNWADASCEPQRGRSSFEREPEGFVETALAGLRTMASHVTGWANRTLTAVVGEKTYQTAGVPRLQSLQRLGQKSGSSTSVLAEPLLTFHYTAASTPGEQLVLHEAMALSGGLGFGVGGNTELIDVNRDGLLDLVKFDGRVSQVFLNEGKGYDSEGFARTEDFSITRVHNGVEITSSPALNEGAGQSLFIRGDVDGDGWPDLLEVRADGTPLAYLRSRDPQQSFLASERGVLELNNGMERPLVILPDSVRRGRALLIDISGDGKDDLLMVKQNSQGRLEWSVLLNETVRGTSFVRFSPQSYAFPFASTDTAILEGAELRFLDMNRDGFIDLVRPAIVDGEYGICVYNNLGRGGFPNQGDSPLFDGDLATDSCRPDQFRLLLGMEKPDRARMMQMWVIDINGDGVEDFADLSRDGRSLDYWLADAGRGTFQGRRNLPLFSDSEPNARLSVDSQNKSNTMVLDFDQDGRDEILIYHTADRRVKVLDFNHRANGQALPAGLLFMVESEDGGRDQCGYTSHIREFLRERAQDPQGSRALSTFPYHEILLKQWIHASSQGLLTGSDDRQTETWDYSKFIWDTSMGSPLGYAEVTVRKPGAIFRSHGSPAQRTVLQYVWRPEDPEAQRYLSDVVEIRSIHESTWSEADETAYGKYLDNLSLDPAEQVYRSEFGPGLTGKSRLLTQDLKDYRYQITTSFAQGDMTNFRSHAFIHLDASEFRICGDDDGACRYPRLEKGSYRYDEKERIIKETITQLAVDGPGGRALKAREISTDYTYDVPSEELGILDNVATLARRRGDGSLIELVENRYHPVLGKVISRTTQHSLHKNAAMLPPSLRNRIAEHELKQTEKFDYDVFGNMVMAGDELGLRAQTTYDSTGVFALKVTNALQDATYYCRSREYCLTGELKLPDGIELPDTIGKQDFIRDENGAWSLAELDGLGRLSILQRSSGYHEIRSYEPYSNEAPNLQHVKRVTGPGPQDSEWEIIYSDSDERELMRIKLVNDQRVELISARIINRWDHAVYEAPVSQLDRTIEAMQDHRKAREWLLNLNGGQINIFDSLGRSTLQIEGEDRQSIRTEYFPWGWQETQQSRDTETKHMSFMGRGENTVEAVWDETGMLQEFERDEQGLITGVRLADEATPREYGYDSRGLPVFVHIPGLLSRVWTYDARGRLVQMLTSDGAGKKPLIGLRYAHDPLDRMLEIRDISSNPERTLRSFSYDQFRDADGKLHEAKGYLVQAGSSNPHLGLDESITFQRDAEGRVLESRHEYRRPDGSLDASFTESYAYGYDEKVRERRTGNGVVLSFAYDALGEVSRIAAQTPWSAQELLFEQGSYDDIGLQRRPSV